MDLQLSTGQIKQLRCLHSGSGLSMASAELIGQINLLIQARSLRDHLGRIVSDPIDSGLTNDDFSMCYAIMNETIQMMRDEAIPLSQLEKGGSVE